MAKQALRKRRLKDKLGLNKQEVIKSGFDQETMDIVWDLMNKKYDGLHDHPRIKGEPEQLLAKLGLFFVVHNVHAAIWAVEERYLKSIGVVSQEYVSAFDFGECLVKNAKVRRFHVVVSDEDNRYYVVPDVIDFTGKEPEF